MPNSPAESPSCGPARDAPPPLRPDAVGAGEILARLWAGKWLILAAALIGLFLAGIWLKTLTGPQYAASMVIAPANESGTEALAKQLSSASNAPILPLAGLSLGPSDVATSFDRFVAHLTSVTMAERLEQDHGVLRRIFARDWNAERGEWMHRAGVVGAVVGEIERFFGVESWRSPTAVTLANFLKRRVVVYPVGRTGLRTVRIQLSDPALARDLLDWIYTEADRLIREEDRARTKAELDYLRDRFEKETVAEYRDSLIKLIAEREQRLMVIELDLPFVAERIEGPTASETPVSPKPMEALFVGLIAGSFVGLIAVLVLLDPRRWRRKEPPAEPF